MQQLYICHMPLCTILKVREITWLDFLRICLLSTYICSEHREVIGVGWKNLHDGFEDMVHVDRQNHCSTSQSSHLVWNKWEGLHWNLQFWGHHECWVVYLLSDWWLSFNMTVTNPFMSEQIDRPIHKERVTIEEGDLELEDIFDFAWTSSLSYFG